MKTRLVTDSTADLPPLLAESLGIQVIPALVNIDGKSYADGVELSRSEFYTRLPQLVPPPTTASPSVGAFQACYEDLLSKSAGTVISIHPPEKLSSIFNSARLAGEAFNGRVIVLDSGQLSLGQGFQVLAAAEAARAGTRLEEILGLVEGIRSRVRVAALLESVKYIHRSGRASWAVAMIGGLLHLRPLVEIRHGIINRLGQARTRLQGVERLVETLQSWGKLERLAVLHTNAESCARELLEKVRTLTRSEPLLVNVTTAIGTHAGPDGLGFAGLPAA
jgi:DegV family protein with EDD domain